MRSKLQLISKTDALIVYAYSVDDSIDMVDGEIEYRVSDDSFRVLKSATNDEDGDFAEWLSPHIWRAINNENCPPERYVVTG